jgi:predicted peptidase
MRRALVIVTLVAALIGAFAASSESAVPNGYSSVGGTSVLVFRPRTPTNRLVLYLHGSYEEASALLNEEVTPLVAEFVRNGFAVVASTGGDDNNYGNPVSVADSVELARQTGYKNIYILAQSMGGIGGIELIDKLHPVAWAGIFPVCNLRNLWARHNGTKEIEEAWGPGPPPKRVSPAKAKDVSGLPVLMFASPEDTEVPIEQNARTCARWMTRGGARVKIVETEGEHGDPSNFQPRRLTQFFLRAMRKR